MFPVRKGRENREIFFSKWIKPTAPEEKNRKRNGIGPAPEEKEEGGGGVGHVQPPAGGEAAEESSSATSPEAHRELFRCDRQMEFLLSM